MNIPGEYITVRANGLEFEVLSAGEGERLALLLHGFPEHAISWRHQIPLLVSLGYRVWAPNQRGYGNSSRPPAPTTRSRICSTTSPRSSTPPEQRR